MKHPTLLKLNEESLKLDIECYGNKVDFAVMCPYTSYWQGIVSQVVDTLFGQFKVDAG